jgi:hypothetical protein
MKNLQTKIDALRTRITELQAERPGILRQRRTRAEVLAAAESQLSRWEAIGRARFSRGLQSLAAGAATTPMLLTGVASNDGVVRVDAGPFIVGVLGIDQVRQAYLADLDQIPEGMAREQREARLAELAASLDDLEAREERLIEESEATEAPIQRRPDARPEIVLAAG